jgi:hypothetical protein
MNGTEIVALILAIIILLKFIILSFTKEKTLEKNIKKLIKKTNLLTILMSVIIIVLFYFMSIELTIPQILVATVFGFLICGLVIIQNPKITLKLVEESIKGKKHIWVSWTIMIILSLLVLFVLL